MVLTKLFQSIIILVIAVILSNCQRGEDNYRQGMVQVDHCKLYYQSYGSGSPIIVLHGGPGLDQSYFLPQMKKLAKHHQVIFYDQRGSGKSLGCKANQYMVNTKQFTKDLDDLRKHFGFDQIILLGHSWGGYLAMNYAINYPNHISKLILVSSLPADYQGQEAFINAFREQTQSVIKQVAPIFDRNQVSLLSEKTINQLYRTLFTAYFYDPTLTSQLTLSLTKASAKSGIYISELMEKTSIMKPNLNLYPKLHTLSIPTLIVHGKQDIIPFWTAEKLNATLPNSTLLTLDHCKHFPFIEQPGPFFATLEKFMGS